VVTVSTGSTPVEGSKLTKYDMIWIM